MGALTGLTSILSPLLTGAGLPGAVVGIGSQLLSQQSDRDEIRRQQGQALSQLQERQKLDEQSASQNAALEKQKIAADAATADERRRLAMRRAVARQKTLFSAQGLGGQDAGSNEAVLLGLINDRQLQQEQSNKLDNLRTQALDQSLSQQKQKNLLQASQLAEQQSLTRYLRGY